MCPAWDLARAYHGSTLKALDYQNLLSALGIKPRTLRSALVQRLRLIKPVTLIVEFEARSVLRVVAVEVDDGQMGGAQQHGGDLGTGKLPDESRAVLGSGPDLKEVVVVLRREVLELNMSS